MYLSVYIARSGLCARRKAIAIIKAGFVKVNGKTEKNPARQVEETAEVIFRGRRVTPREHQYVVLNKPSGYFSSCSDECGRKTVVELIGSRERLFPMGRLDATTEGVILLTTDGALAQKLLHPKHDITKEYHVELDKPLHEKDFEIIRSGVDLPDGKIKPDEIRMLGKKGTNVSVKLSSGKNRIIRRMFGALGYHVHGLERVKFAGITNRGLARGAWRKLTRSEVKRLQGL
ncbi:MAG: Pseudouridine synthase [candidate division TM6 bacterium GW2011_GWE2_41_16]|nr:MAG: Pseudouridine synthase [candidate division TM6 bacterium GW2011_GWE2_41_16]